MDRVQAVGASSTAWQMLLHESRMADSAPWAAQMAEPEATPMGSLDANASESADQEQLTLHFMSHISAECFISLLQTMDPLPDDERDRAEYKRFYRQLHDVLEVPLPPADPRPIGTPADPLG